MVASDRSRREGRLVSADVFALVSRRERRSGLLQAAGMSSSSSSSSLIRFDTFARVTRLMLACCEDPRAK